MTLCKLYTVINR